MAEWFETGRFVYLVLSFIALEILLLAWWHRRSGRGLPPVEVAGNLAAGALIFMALERSASGAHWIWVAVFAALSFPAHAIDLRRRWLRASEESESRNKT